MRISVALAAYRGEKYIAQLVGSVLAQLGVGDEVIISDDLPSGRTREALDAFISADERIKYIEGPGEGVVKNFQNALEHTSGDVIFYADQDDVWLPGKAERVLAAVRDGADVVLHDAAVTDENLSVTQPSFFAAHGTRAGIFRNIARNSYVGCCMAMTARMKGVVLPFPEGLPMHDQWTGILGERFGRVELIDEPLILWRRHPDAVTGASVSAAQRLIWRKTVVTEYLKRVKEVQNG